MLQYYPEDDYYIIENSKGGFCYIDRDSNAFDFCEFFRLNYGAKEDKDIDGEYYLNVLISDYRVSQIREFVRLETTLRYVVAKGK